MKLYDTLTGETREFVPTDGKVRMYVCGITPYSSCHVGHAMSYIIFDVLRRYLEFTGLEVEHVQNFTDIDDKIIQRAQQAGLSIDQLAEQYIDEFLANMDGLNIQRAHRYPRATQEVPGIIKIIHRLEEQGYAYASEGDVYFRVGRSQDYGKLSRRNLEGLLAGARIEPGAGKEDPMDFTLWKGAKPGDPAWDSPWGPGRPGWHIECTAMSMEYLGETVDIHGGGQDLVFPHHENELAQSEAYTQKVPFARHWVHNGLLHMGDDKMSKSLGNLVAVSDALERHTSDAFRLLFLSTHYTHPQTYSEDNFNSMERGAERLRTPMRQPANEDAAESVDPGPYREQFLQAMETDLNTPQALAALFDLSREINRASEEGKSVRQAQEALTTLSGVLGLTLEDTRQRGSQQIGPFVELLLGVRGQLRTAKQYALADSIRSGLSELGIALEDTPQGTEWRYANTSSTKE